MHPKDRILKFVAYQFVILLHVNIYAQFGNRIDCGEVECNDIKEASGIAASRVNPGVLWVHNDSGDKARIFAMDQNGKHLGTFYLENCEARDWEDIAIGPGTVDSCSYIYIGDIGDNNAEHAIKYIYRFKEPDVSLSESPQDHLIKDIEILRVRYPDGRRDAEALMVDPLTKEYYVITKRELNVKVYKSKFTQPAKSINVMKCVDTLDIAIIVAADISPSGLAIIMKNYHAIYYWKRHPGETIAHTLHRKPERLPYVKEPQGEAVAWDCEGNGYYTISEESGAVPCHLYYYPRIGNRHIGK